MSIKGDPKVIKQLNLALKKELTAIHQYFLHARMLEDWGVLKMADHEEKEANEERQHADLFTRRILLLGGRPDLQTLETLLIGHDVKSVIECDLKLELGGIDAYRKAVKICEEAQDYVSRDLFIKVLAEEEGHADALKTQLQLIEQMGVENYILLQSAPQDEKED